MTTGEPAGSHRALAKVRQAARKVYGWLQNRWVRWFIQAAVLVSCALYLASIWDQATALLQETQPNYAFLAAALALTSFSAWLGAVSWTWMLQALGQPARWLAYSRAQLLSNLAKYLPGYAWQYLGKAYMTHSAGVPAGVIGIGMAVEFALLALAGLGMMAIFFPTGLALEWSGDWAPAAAISWLRMMLLLACAGGMLLIPAILNRLSRRGVIPGWQPVPLLGVLGIMFSNWLCMGLSFWLLEWVFQTGSLVELPVYIFTLAAAFLVGLAIVIIPGGIGVREGIMALLLSPVVQWPLPILIATISRMVFIISEILTALAIEIVWRRQQGRSAHPK